MAVATTVYKAARVRKNIRQVTTGLDGNDTASVTPGIATGEASAIALQVIGVSGAHTTHVVKLQGSVDGSTYVDTTTTVTGAGGALLTTPVYPFHRAKVTTAEGAASGITVGIFAKAINP